jgi:GntR family transcriptional regulator/MocR family aminotransferase
MAKSRSSIALPALGPLDRKAGPMGQQLAQGLREAIAKGALKPGERLPSTRTLATSLGLARGTVTAAFEQLGAEGYLVAEVGAGTRVAASLGEAMPAAPPDSAVAPQPALRNAARIAWLAAVGRSLTPLPQLPFSVAVPTDAAAPDDNWRRLGNRVRATRAAAPATYADARGEPELRAAIADYVRKSRAVRCEPDQVLVTAGTQQGLFLAGRVLLSSGDPVWTEDPAYLGMTAVLDDLGLISHRIPVDAQGFDIDAAMAACPEARAAFVTPSHQYPVGMPMSMSRRTALLAWARQNDAWVVEDDYDSELRYAGHPFPSMQGLDPSRVVYLGTLSKVLFPSLRLGYAVVPPSLVEAFAGARTIIDRHSPTADQHVMAAYMREGHFEAHIRRIRNAYAERRAVLIAAIARELSPWLTVEPSDQGMHLTAWLAPGLDDMAIAARARAAGIVIRAISPMYARSPRSGFMLGFGGFPAAQLEEAVLGLKAVLAAT